MTSPFVSRPGAVGDPVQHYGNPLTEQRALLRGAAVVDLADREVVTVTGPDRLSWLDSLTSQRLTGLAPGESTETLLLDPSGRVEYAARVLDDGETLWLLVDAGFGAPFAAFLDRMRFMLRVEVADRSADFATLGMIGQPAEAIAAAAAPAGVPLVWNDPWMAVTAGGHQYAAVKTHPGVEWDYREVLVERAQHAALAALPGEQLPAAGLLALDALRIAAWRPRLASEVDATTLPHELDWLRSAVHLSKGCYRGQETVAKVHNLGHPPRRLVMLHLDGSESLLPQPGDEVVVPGADGADPKPVGRVTSAARHHELGPVALAVVKRSVDTAATLQVTTADGVIAAAQEVVVPPSAGAAADVPRLPRLGAVRR